MRKLSVCHLTSVHQQFDIRIFHKELISLKNAGYGVYQISQGQSGVKEGVNLIGLGKPPESRIKRILFFTRKVYKEAIRLNADVYHIHDPELLPVARKLVKKEKIVIFDSHENVPGQIEEKTYIPSFIRKLIARIYAGYENKVVRKIAGVICVSPNFTERMRKQNINSVTVTNYPLLSEEYEELTKYNNQEITNAKNSLSTGKDNYKICFPGLISEEWCHLELLDAIKNLDLKYVLCGPEHEAYFKNMQNHSSWTKVAYLGTVSRKEVGEIIRNSNLGMALARKCPNTDWDVGTLGNTKLFEYMLQKRPVCCTNFELWQEIVDQYSCGICVEPDQPEQIKEAIEWFINNQEEAKRMGERGYQAVIEKYNWSTQEKILLDFYAKLKF